MYFKIFVVESEDEKMNVGNVLPAIEEYFGNNPVRPYFGQDEVESFNLIVYEDLIDFEWLRDKISLGKPLLYMKTKFRKQKETDSVEYWSIDWTIVDDINEVIRSIAEYNDKVFFDVFSEIKKSFINKRDIMDLTETIVYFCNDFSKKEIDVVRKSMFNYNRDFLLYTPYIFDSYNRRNVKKLVFASKSDSLYEINTVKDIVRERYPEIEFSYINYYGEGL